jgi:serine/threonine protein kinase/tetratricopeptide (TPR) repeat protein
VKWKGDPLTPERWAKVREIFERAVESSDRNAVVAEACCGDEDLRREVESLLVQHSDIDDLILDQPVVKTFAINFTPAEPVPAKIGKYRILGVLGTGGMGAVYKAEQEHPRRIVALKVVRPGRVGPELLRRFELESQALGRLQHPGIAQIYEAGTADTGFGLQPYFAMEYIQGDTLQQWVKKNNLSTRQRLELMASICLGVDHAHQRGLIHRDLKPANILVDSTGQPKILDFGIARVTDSDAQATSHTDVGQLVGTLNYMSPEQMLADPLELDTRSDVYSLGVVLFELLAGCKPFDLRGGVHEAARKIREQDPPRLGSINRAYCGDIETIVAKALEKNKARRYGSAAALCADIRHYLENEPITARPPSATYQLHKFGQRHRALVFGTAAVFLTLIGGVIATAREARRVSLERDTATAINDFLQHDLLAQASAGAQASPDTEPDPDLKVRTALDRAAAKIDNKFQKQPQVEASLRQTIANAYEGLGLYEEARRQMELALDLDRRTVGEEHPETLRVTAALADLYDEEGEYAKAEQFFARALSGQRRKLGDASPDTLTTMDDLGLLYLDQAKYSDAEPLLVEVLQTRRRTNGDNEPDTLVAKNNLALLYSKEGRYEQAEPLYTQVLDTRRRVLGPEHPSTLISMNNLAALYAREHRDDKAEPLMTAVLESQQRILGDKHPDTLSSMDNLAALYRRKGDYARSEAIFRQAIEKWRQSVGEEHPDTLLSMAGLATLYCIQGRLPEAEKLDARVLDARTRVLGPKHPDTIEAMVSLARVRVLEHKFADAEPLLRASLQDPGKTTGDWTHYFRQALLGASLVGQAKFQDAEPLLVQGYEGMAQREDSVSTENRAFIRESGQRIVQMYAGWHKPDQAAAWRAKVGLTR